MTEIEDLQLAIIALRQENAALNNGLAVAITKLDLMGNGFLELCKALEERDASVEMQIFALRSQLLLLTQAFVPLPERVTGDFPLDKGDEDIDSVD